MDKVWVLHLDCSISEEYPDGKKPTYEYFGDEIFLFRDNHEAVDFIRQKAEAWNINEIWHDVDWPDGSVECTTYMAFRDDYENEIYVHFNTHKIN